MQLALGKTHSYDVAIAVYLNDTDAAVMVERFRFLISYNKALENKRWYQNDRWWCYTSVRSLSNIFPNLSRRQVERILSKLSDTMMIKNLTTFGKQKFTVLAFKDEFLYLIDDEPKVSRNGDTLEPKVSRNGDTVSRNGDTKLLYNGSKELKPSLAEPIDSAIVDFCERFKKVDLMRFGKQKRFTEGSWPKTLIDWSVSVDRIQRIDGIDLDTLINLHKIVIDDEFWMDKVRSPLKYRRKNKDGNTYYEYLFSKFMKEEVVC